MASNEPFELTQVRRVFTYFEARDYDRYLNSKITKSPHHRWVDVKTGGTVVFNHF